MFRESYPQKKLISLVIEQVERSDRPRCSVMFEITAAHLSQDIQE